MMKKYFAVISVFLAFSSIAQADNDVREKAYEAAQGIKHAAHAVGRDVRQGAHHVAAAAKRAKNHVILRCGDGRHALSRPTACQGHGGVSKN
jgi:predicted small secreted protein